MNMKKLLAVLAAVVLMLTAFAAVADEAVLNVGVMAGPTGMGLAKLMNEADPAYHFEVYSAPTDATADLASGALDLLCLPTNTAANLANAKADYISVAAINCLGSLYLITDGTVEIASVADLDGQTIYASVVTSTTGPILDYIFAQNGVNVNVEWEADHDALAAAVIQGNVHIAVLPEPKATAAMTKAEGWKVALNISTEWEKVCDTALTMGCIVVRNDVLTAKGDAVNAFLEKMADSVTFIGDPANRDESAEMIAAAGILPAAGVAKKALGNLYGSIVYMDGAEMKTALQGFYSVIGVEQPADGFYYAK